MSGGGCAGQVLREGGVDAGGQVVVAEGEGGDGAGVHQAVVPALQALLEGVRLQLLF